MLGLFSLLTMKQCCYLTRWDVSVSFGLQETTQVISVNLNLVFLETQKIRAGKTNLSSQTASLLASEHCIGDMKGSNCGTIVLEAQEHLSRGHWLPHPQDSALLRLSIFLSCCFWLASLLFSASPGFFSFTASMSFSLCASWLLCHCVFCESLLMSYAQTLWKDLLDRPYTIKGTCRWSEPRASPPRISMVTFLPGVNLTQQAVTTIVGI